MSDLSDAELAVAEARREVHEYFVLLAATEADKARAAVARLEAAIRHHDAERQREAIAKTDDPVFYQSEAGWLPDLIDPAAPPA